MIAKPQGYYLFWMFKRFGTTNLQVQVIIGSWWRLPLFKTITFTHVPVNVAFSSVSKHVVSSLKHLVFFSSDFRFSQILKNDIPSLEFKQRSRGAAWSEAELVHEAVYGRWGAEVGIFHLVGESKKIGRPIHRSALPCDKKKNFVSIYHPTINSRVRIFSYSNVI